MPHPPNPAPRSRRCKIKAVNPPFRSVSTPRSTKDLPNLGPVNPGGALGKPSEAAPASDWNAERLCERLRGGETHGGQTGSSCGRDLEETASCDVHSFPP